MEYFSFSCMAGLKNSDVEECLKKNPQLKRIKLSICSEVDDCIFQTIAKYVPEIESIRYYSRSRINMENVKYFGRLSKLKILDLYLKQANKTTGYVLSVVHEIASANIELELLHLGRFDLKNESQKFVDGISKLKKLKTLRLEDIQNLTGSHFISMCKPLNELSEVAVERIGLKMTNDDLLNFIRNADKLERFDYNNAADFPQRIGVDTFEKLVQIINQRVEKTKLNLCLSERAFTADIPADLREAASDLLKLRIEYY